MATMVGAETPFGSEVPAVEVASRLGLGDLASLAVACPAIATAFRAAYLPPSSLDAAPAGISVECQGEVMDLICCILAVAMCSGQVSLHSLKKNDGKTVLTMAAAAGRPDVVRWLLHTPGCAALVDQRDANGASPLHYAALAGHDHVCEVLLAGGASAEAADSTGLRPLHLAAEGGYFQTCKVLLEGGAEVNARDGDSVTPLLLAVEQRHVEVCAFLTRKRADPLASSIHGRTPMMVAGETDGHGLRGALEAALWPGERKRSGPEAIETLRRHMRLRGVL
mmetsp:Transcript_6912/g.21087  ORF Transcript_6912/g.21087 Transcript_6912/m.21087 type:complete len:280 (-) Transcript_6912:176-1015(-)